MLLLAGKMPHFYPLQNEVKKSPCFAAKILQASCAAKETWVELEISLVFQNPPEEKGDTYIHKNRGRHRDFLMRKIPQKRSIAGVGEVASVFYTVLLGRLAIFRWFTPIFGWRFLSNSFCRVNIDIE